MDSYPGETMRFWNTMIHPVLTALRAWKSRSTTAETRLCVEGLESRDVPTVYDLGAAADFNLFTFDDVNAFNSDVEGRVAVGDDGTFANYGIGTKLTNSNGTRDDLITEGDLSYTNGQVFFGNIVHGGVGSLQSVGTPNGTVRQQAGVVDFAAAQADLLNTSAVLATELPNGTTMQRGSRLLLRGTHPLINIFTITEAQIESVRRIAIRVPSGSQVLINVEGTDVDISNMGLGLRGASCENVLWNFNQAQSLSMSAIGWEGSILAPSADLDFNNGQIEGTVVVDSMRGNGQFHHCPSQFAFDIPEKASVAGFVFEKIDPPNDVRYPYEAGVANADLYLTGVDILGRSYNLNQATLIDGDFLYTNLWPGTYTVTVEPPNAFQDSNVPGIPGTVSAVTVGTPAPNAVTSIVLGPGDAGIDYLLPLIRRPD